MHLHGNHGNGSRGARELKRKAGHKARRWVERTHSWLNRLRRILVRWEELAGGYIAMLHLAFGVVIGARSRPTGVGSGSSMESAFLGTGAPRTL